MGYADVEYLGIEHLDAEFINGAWYYERKLGEVYSFPNQSGVRPLDVIQDCPRHHQKFQDRALVGKASIFSRPGSMTHPFRA